MRSYAGSSDVNRGEFFLAELKKVEAKFNHLKNDGWSLEDIGAWARGHLVAREPDVWPPDHEVWRKIAYLLREGWRLSDAIAWHRDRSPGFWAPHLFYLTSGNDEKEYV